MRCHVYFSCISEIPLFKSSTVDPDRTTHSLTSHPGLHLLQWFIFGMLGNSRFMTNWDIHQIFAISLLLRWLRCCFAVILTNDSFIISGKAWYVIDPSEVIHRSNLKYKAQIPKALDIKLNFYLSRDMTKQTKWLCVQRRLKSAWACAQSVRVKKAWVLSYPLSAQRKLWSDWADAKADLSLRWAHTHFVGFVMSRLIYLDHNRRIRTLNASY